MNKKRENKRKRILTVFLGILLSFRIVFLQTDMAMAEEDAEIKETELYAKAAVLMDGDSGRVLYSKNGDLVLPMASTTKIMTCIVALEQGNPEDTVTISSYAASQPKVHLGMRKGDTFRMEDLLYSLMLESHNDAAVAIAEHIGGKFLSLPPETERSAEESRQAVASFVALMNEKAEELGCTDTWFITPNGLDASQEVTLENGETVIRQHSTTAVQLAAIMRYCTWFSPQREKFLEITREKSYGFAELSGRQNYQCNNHNSFLDMMDGALSGKTGFTNGAGYCYVGALEKDGKLFTVALLACGWPNNKTWKWTDTRKLMEYGLENYEVHSLEEFAYDETLLNQAEVTGGQTERIGQTAYTNLVIEKRKEGYYAGVDHTAHKDLSGRILLREDEQIEVLCSVQTKLTAPVRAGEKVGIITYLLNGEELLTEEVVTEQEIGKIDFRWCFGQIWSMFLME